MALSHGAGQIVMNGLVLYLDAANPKSYSGSGTTWTDLSGNGNNGTLTNGPTFSSANGGSLVFDGINDFVDLGNPSSLDITTTITHNIWLYPISHYATGYNGIFTKANSASTGGSLSHTLIYIDNTANYVAKYGKSDGTAGSSVVDAITFNQWVCYTSTYDGTNIILYKNGIEVNRESQTGSIYNTNQNTGVIIGRDGRYSFDNGRQYNGRLEQVSMYNRALTASEIQQNFNATKSRFGL